MELSKWKPIRHYRELIGSGEDKNFNDDKSGIYIWCFKVNENEYIPYYVGKSADIAWRLTQHMSDLIGGNYTIHKKEDILKISNYGMSAIKSVKGNEPVDGIYEPSTVENKVRFIKLRKETDLNSHLDFMIENFYFTYHEIENYSKNGTNAEKAVINAIGKDNLINKRGGKQYGDFRVTVKLPVDLLKF